MTDGSERKAAKAICAAAENMMIVNGDNAPVGRCFLYVMGETE